MSPAAAFDPGDLPAHYRARVLVDEAGCWIWQGYVNNTGYVYVKRSGKMIGLHRVVYEILVGPIPEGADLDHLCHNGTGCKAGRSCRHRRCCNPAHLLVATRRENLLRGESVAALHATADVCANGHPYDEVNTYWRTDRRGRQCRVCTRERVSVIRGRRQ